MKKIIGLLILILLLISTTFIILDHTNKKNYLIFKCYELKNFNKLSDLIKKNNSNFLMIDNVLCSDELNKINKTHIDELLKLKVDHLMLNTGFINNDDIVFFLNNSNINKIDIGICSKKGDKIKIEHKDGKVYCGLK